MIQFTIQQLLTQVMPLRILFEGWVASWTPGPAPRLSNERAGSSVHSRPAHAGRWHGPWGMVLASLASFSFLFSGAVDPAANTRWGNAERALTSLTEAARGIGDAQAGARAEYLQAPLGWVNSNLAEPRHPSTSRPAATLCLSSGAHYLAAEEVHSYFAVVATGYSSTPDQTDDTPFITATNQPVRSGILALSRDLLREFTPHAPFGYGDEVVIPGVGRFVVEDTMHHRWRSRVDIWFPTREEAINWGVRQVRLVPA